MSIKKLTPLEVFALFDKNTANLIWHQLTATYPTATAMVCFENQMLDSSDCGKHAALAVGPDNTYKSVEACEGHWLNDLPSQRQYPVAWVPAAEIRVLPEPPLVYYIENATKKKYHSNNGWVAFQFAGDYSKETAERLAAELRKRYKKDKIEVIT